MLKIRFELRVLDDKNLLFHVIDQNECMLRFDHYKTKKSVKLVYPNNGPQLLTNKGKIEEVHIRGTNDTLDPRICIAFVDNAIEEKRRILETFDSYFEKHNDSEYKIRIDDAPFYDVDRLISFYLSDQYFNRNIVWGCSWLDESLRGNVEFKATNEIKICSRSYPQILLNNRRVYRLYLRGHYKSFDKYLSVTYVDNASEEKIRILKALQEWVFTFKKHKYSEEDLYNTNIFEY